MESELGRLNSSLKSDPTEPLRECLRASAAQPSVWLAPLPPLAPIGPDPGPGGGQLSAEDADAIERMIMESGEDPF